MTPSDVVLQCVFKNLRIRLLFRISGITQQPSYLHVPPLSPCAPPFPIHDLFEIPAVSLGWTSTFNDAYILVSWYKLYTAIQCIFSGAPEHAQGRHPIQRHGRTGKGQELGFYNVSIQREAHSITSSQTPIPLTYVVGICSEPVLSRQRLDHLSRNILENRNVPWLSRFLLHNNLPKLFCGPRASFKRRQHARRSIERMGCLTSVPHQCIQSRQSTPWANRDRTSSQ